MRLRSIELVLPKAADAADFLVNVWHTKLAASPADARTDAKANTHYIRGSGSFPYLVALEEGEESFVRSVTFVCEQADIDRIEQNARAKALNVTPETSADLGGGHGIIVEMPEGELFRFLTGSEEVDALGACLK